MQLFLETHNLDGDFVSAACWIQGVYVFKELRNRVDKVAYFGMPKNIDFEGQEAGTDNLCNLRPKLNEKKSDSCLPMTKIFYLHQILS